MLYHIVVSDSASVDKGVAPRADVGELFPYWFIRRTVDSRIGSCASARRSVPVTFLAAWTRGHYQRLRCLSRGADPCRHTAACHP